MVGALAVGAAKKRDNQLQDVDRSQHEEEVAAGLVRESGFQSNLWLCWRLATLINKAMQVLLLDKLLQAHLQQARAPTCRNCITMPAVLHHHLPQ